MAVGSSDKAVQSFEDLCRDVVDEFLEDHRQDGLTDSPFVKVVLEKTRAHSDDSESNEDEFERAKQFVGELEKRKREGRTFRILERVTPFLANFGALIRVCENSMQSAPFGVGIAFTGLRLILDLATKSHELMNAVLDAIGEISTYLDYYKIVLEGQSEPSIVSKGIRRSYRRILGFWCHSAQILSKSKMSFAVSSLVRDLKKDVQEFKDGISLDASQVDQSLSALNAVAEARKRICEWIAGTRDAVLQRPQKALNDHLCCRTEGTCEWMFDTPEFKEWKSAKGNAILWYNADPATGKSVLTSAVINHLMAQLDLKVVYFFYSFVDSSRREIYSGVRSLAFQLLARLNPIPLRLKAEYAKATDDNMYYLGNDDTSLLKLVLKILLDRYPEVYIALDGLDECSDEKAHVSRALEELFTLDTTGSVKWFIASRDVSEVRYSMQRLKASEIKQPTDAISRDIQTYRKSMRMCPTHDYEWFDNEEQSFLYTKLLCESLRSKGFGSTKGNWEDLQKFPIGLEGTYLSALGRIAKLGHREKKLARQVFQILTLAKKLLTVGELLDALNLHVITTIAHPEKDPSQHLSAVKEVCSPLLTIEGDGPCQTVRLCHKTVKDFFLDAKHKKNAAEGLKEFFVDESASGELGLHCLEYLSHKRYQELPRMDEQSEAAWFEEHPFLRYAAIYWYYHLWHAEPTPEVIEGVEDFLQSPAFLTCIYCHIYLHATGKSGGARAIYQ
ncbi:hypothetical protein NW766_011836 [Fusarium irregulare]|uniref:Vegetative incompatibility protein HET-E-1 n=1 Tax=Fusarium irregulare TaxID=2494466 RepID=A0A9W8U412_9HYPO|nr:hypothetical protein NW766_011836 [Fusarium irregulare]